ncbi:SRPBCC family protein [Nocardioides piscis]|uniref:SRPBCC family protein n=1 Tax=Nocardioides piscis TaxID=2714938 RepID=A0A6G7YE29_9ACTN|nr:SRPBCC family protein [Nocardioides piscis]QIK74936.1 SRPBCC family protein [Nocardioides piscis]
MTDTVAPVLEESITIQAPPDRVWSLVSDLGRMSRWSPQVVKTFVRGRPIGLGTTMVNINRRGVLVWPTRTRVVRFEPREEVAFRVKDNFTIWSFRLTHDGAGGTLLTQRREAPDGISDISHKLTDRLLGGVAAFQVELGDGMRQTLARIKAEAEG